PNLKFALQVNSAPHSGQGSETAYRFCHAALQQGHEILRVFFYFEGTYHALASCVPDDEKNIVKRWSELAIQENVDLVVCVSAATRRGLAQDDPVKNEQMWLLIAEGFRIAGLGQWVEAGILADRLLIFGD
ncbi:MAG: sulfurtransferase complex subunit TusD, partial [Methylococcales bacterium]